MIWTHPSSLKIWLLRELLKKRKKRGWETRRSAFSRFSELVPRRGDLQRLQFCSEVAGLRRHFPAIVNEIRDSLRSLTGEGKRRKKARNGVSVAFLCGSDARLSCCSLVFPLRARTRANRKKKTIGNSPFRPVPEKLVLASETRLGRDTFHQDGADWDTT